MITQPIFALPKNKKVFPYGFSPLGFLVAEVAQLVEHYLAKVRVAGSNLVFRSWLYPDTEIRNRDFYYRYICTTGPGGGTGRHAGLKILFAEYASTGSIPVWGTTAFPHCGRAVFLDHSRCLAYMHTTSM